LIIRFSGGLGNQMFQFAYLTAQQKRYPDERVVADIGDYDTYIHHNGFEIEKIFGLDIPKCSESEKESHRIQMTIKNKILWRLGLKEAGFPKRIQDNCNGFDCRFLEKFKDEDFLWGYWQSERYFANCKQEIENLLKFPEITDEVNVKISSEIMAENSVAIHIRRGDYLKFPELVDLSETEYYLKSIELVKQKENIKKHWFIFSDDIEWCKKNLCLSNEKITYVVNNTGNNSFRDMQLMSLCNYIIVANSTFSWWAAWLADNPKLIIAPKNYYNNKPGFDEDICPESWVRI